MDHHSSVDQAESAQSDAIPLADAFREFTPPDLIEALDTALADPAAFTDKFPNYKFRRTFIAGGEEKEWKDHQYDDLSKPVGTTLTAIQQWWRKALGNQTLHASGFCGDLGKRPLEAEWLRNSAIDIRFDFKSSMIERCQSRHLKLEKMVFRSVTIETPTARAPTPPTERIATDTASIATEAPRSAAAGKTKRLAKATDDEIQCAVRAYFATPLNDALNQKTAPPAIREVLARDGKRAQDKAIKAIFLESEFREHRNDRGRPATDAP